MRVLIVGECYVSGYKVSPGASFSGLLGTYMQAAGRCLSPLPLKRHERIREALAEDHPDLVVLQLGNYEFHGSVKRVFNKYGKRSGSHCASPGSEAGAEGVPPVAVEPPVRMAFRVMILPVFVLYLIGSNRGFLKTIRSYISMNPDSRFIVLTPIPCLMFSDNIIRRIAGRYFRMLFARMDNVRFVDLFEHRDLFGPDCYTDASHLNERGHRKLFEHIVRCV